MHMRHATLRCTTRRYARASRGGDRRLDRRPPGIIIMIIIVYSIIITIIMCLCYVSLLFYRSVIFMFWGWGRGFLFQSATACRLDKATPRANPTQYNDGLCLFLTIDKLY